MLIIVTACLISDPATCKTLEQRVEDVKTQSQCVALIKAKAKDYPEWRVKGYSCKD